MPEKLRITVYSFEELNEELQMQIMESVAGEFLRKYMDGKVENLDLYERIRKAVEADNYKMIKHGIMDLAYVYIITICQARKYLEDGTRVI